MKYKLNRRTQKLLLGIFILILSALTGIDAADLEPLNSWVEPSRPGYHHVLHVDDGDTITVASPTGSEEVRLIGVDTPELHHPDKPVQCWAENAKAFTEAVIRDQPIRLVADFKDDNRDLYGRLLRYVYLPDGTLVNEELIKRGHGFAYTLFPFEKRGSFQALGWTAQQQQLGLWQHCHIKESGATKETNPI